MTRLAERLTLLAPLQHQPYRLLFTGQLISNIGDWLDILALVALLLYRWELGPGAWGAVLTATTVPYALLGPFAGVWVDRWDRRTVMVICDLARAPLAFVLIWAPNLAVVLVVVTVSNVFSAFHLPAQQAAIRQTVPDEDLMAANALGQLASNGARLLGPALGGLAVAVGGARLAFILDGITFIVSAVILSRLPNLLSRADDLLAEHSFFEELRSGLRHIRTTTMLLIGVSAMVSFAFLIRSTDTLVTLVLKALGFSEGMQGLSATALGMGYVAGALVVGQWGERFRSLSIFGTGIVVVGCMLAGIGVAAALGLSGIGVMVAAGFAGRLVLGMGYGSLVVAYGYILQRNTPGAMMGRISATSQSLIAGIPLVSPLIGTALASWLGLGQAFALLGLMVLGVGALVVLIPARGVTGDSQRASGRSS